MTERIRKRVIYRGRVQGVGFRATASSVASKFKVTGYVRNLADGTVELVTEGPEAEVNAFIAALAQRMDGYIKDCNIETGEPGDPLRDFRIEY